MKCIQQLSDKIKDEIKDAHEYASLALNLRDSDKDLRGNVLWMRKVL